MSSYAFVPHTTHTPTSTHTRTSTHTPTNTNTTSHAHPHDHAGTTMAGISGLQMGPMATWDDASRRGGYSVGDLARWWSEQPARLAGLWDRKGSLEVGGLEGGGVVWM